jgi:hypothetical protein
MKHMLQPCRPRPFLPSSSSIWTQLPLFNPFETPNLKYVYLARYRNNRQYKVTTASCKTSKTSKTSKPQLKRRKTKRRETRKGITHPNLPSRLNPDTTLHLTTANGSMAAPTRDCHLKRLPKLEREIYPPHPVGQFAPLDPEKPSCYDGKWRQLSPIRRKASTLAS